MKLEDINVTQYLFSPIKSIVSRPRQIVTAALSVYASSLPGDFLETGVFIGGTSVIMARVFEVLLRKNNSLRATLLEGYLFRGHQ